MSETGIPVGQGLRYPPQAFMDPEFTATVSQMEEEEEEQEGSKNKFLRKYCDICMKCGETYCWCFSLDWEEGLLDVANPNANINTSSEKIPSPNNNREPPNRMHKA